MNSSVDMKETGLRVPETSLWNNSSVRGQTPQSDICYLLEGPREGASGYLKGGIQLAG